MTMETAAAAPAIPPHVPPELVREYPITVGRYVKEDPYKTIIPALHTFRLKPGAGIWIHLGGMVQPSSLPLVW